MASLNVGQVVDGYRFNGGDPNIQDSWSSIDTRDSSDRKVEAKALEPKAISVGDEVDGYRFNGGDPNSQDSWSKSVKPSRSMGQAAQEFLPDVGNALQVGYGKAAAGVGWLGEKLGADDTIRQYWTDYVKEQSSQYSDRAKEAQGKDMSTDDIGGALLKMSLGISESMPGMVMSSPVGAGVGYALTKTAQMLAAEGASSAFIALAGGTAQATGNIGKMMAAAPATIGASVGEGVQAGMSSAAQIQSEVERMPREKVRNTPGFQEIYNSLPDAPGREDMAHKMLANAMGNYTAARVIPATAGLGAIAGGGVMGQMIQRQGGKMAAETALVGARKGGIEEARQEFFQSGSDKLIENTRTQKYINPDQATWEGVPRAAIEGALIGGPMGAGFGGASAYMQNRADLTNGLEFDQGRIEALARQQLDPSNAQIRVITPNDISQAPDLQTAASLITQSFDQPTGLEAEIGIQSNGLDIPTLDDIEVPDVSLPGQLTEVAPASGEGQGLIAGGGALDGLLPGGSIDAGGAGVGVAGGVSPSGQDSLAMGEPQQQAPVDPYQVTEDDWREALGERAPVDPPPIVEQAPIATAPQGAVSLSTQPTETINGTQATETTLPDLQEEARQGQGVPEQVTTQLGVSNGLQEQGQAPSKEVALQVGTGATVQKSTTFRKGTMTFTGVDVDEVRQAVADNKLPVQVVEGKDGSIKVTGINLKQKNILHNAVLGKEVKPAKAKQLSGNLKNDLDIIAPGLFSHVQSGGDGEANDAPWGDIALIAEKLRDEENYMLPYDSENIADDLRELIRQHSSDSPVLNERRALEEKEKQEASEYRSGVLKEADALGLKGTSPRRTLADVEAEITKVVQERAEWLAEAQEAARLADEIAEAKLIDAFNLEEGSYKNETRISRDDRAAESARESAEALAQEDRDELDQAAPTAGGEGFTLEGQTPEQIRQDEEREAQRIKDERDAEVKAKVDAEVGSFSLSGSNRAADRSDQNDMFGNSPIASDPKKEQNTPRETAPIKQAEPNKTAPSGAVSVSGLSPEQRAALYKALTGKTISLEYEVNGETAKVERDASDALREVDERVASLEALLTCVRG